MTAHVVYPAWDAHHPATLSPTIITSIVRDQMAFQGVIVTDDLGMAGVADVRPWEDVVVQALRAGADVLLICHHRQRQEQAYRRVISAVQDGVVPEALVDRAVARIQNLKERLEQCRAGGMIPAPLKCIGSAAHHSLVETVRRCARESARVESSHDA
jgi:beta-N-acetylhexosaminidase